MTKEQAWEKFAYKNAPFDHFKPRFIFDAGYDARDNMECVCVKSKSPLGVYYVGHDDKPYYRDEEWDFCPYCSGKIKEK